MAERLHGYYQLSDEDIVHDAAGEGFGVQAELLSIEKVQAEALPYTKETIVFQSTSLEAGVVRPPQELLFELTE